jgi:hypothetical protein
MLWRLAVMAALGAAVAVRATPQTQETAPAATASSRTEARRADSERLLQRIRAGIAGREHEPAGRVFTNIRLGIFKRIPAEDLLDVMDGGYSRALGVSCTHCHVEDDFASDAKRPKQAAREMAAMHLGINRQLARMRHLESDPEDRFINCGTCHRGTLHPQKPSP